MTEVAKLIESVFAGVRPILYALVSAIGVVEPSGPQRSRATRNVTDSSTIARSSAVSML